MRVQRWYQHELLAAGGEKALPAADADFLQCLKAIGDERRADDRKSLDAAPGEIRQQLVGIGLDPGGASQPRLKGNAELLRGQAQPLRLGARRLERLRAVTADILFDEPFAAVR